MMFQFGGCAPEEMSLVTPNKSQHGFRGLKYGDHEPQESYEIRPKTLPCVASEARTPELSEAAKNLILLTELNTIARRAF
jgi:hypothetical protein